MILAILGVALSTLIPPLQSPDEASHLIRAYLFSKGQLLLEPPPSPDTGSGGYVDDGLIAYGLIYSRITTKADRHLTAADVEAADALKWQQTRSFVAVEGTGYYLPLAYLPHAVAFLAGEQLGLTIDHTYRLTRLLAFLASLAVMAFALRVFPTNALAIVLLALPMSVFQLLSASLDGWTTALALLALSLFMRGMCPRYDFPRWMMYLLAVCLLIIACSRTHLMPLTVLPLVIYFKRKDLTGIWCSVATGLFALAWLAHALKTTILGPERMALGGGSYGHYLGDPLDVLYVVANTLSDDETMEFYWRSFVGILGWLDTELAPWFYPLSGYMLLAAAALSLSFRFAGSDTAARAALLVLALVSSILVFLALLVTWTPYPAAVVAGVQGRYFLVPALMAAYALAGDDDVLTALRGGLSVVLIASYGSLAAYAMSQALLFRYYL